MKRISTLAATLAVLGAFAVPATSQASLPTGGKCTVVSGTSVMGSVTIVTCKYSWDGATRTATWDKIDPK